MATELIGLIGGMEEIRMVVVIGEDGRGFR